jgi:cytochrome P450
MEASGIDLTPIVWADTAGDPYPLYRVLRDERPVYYDEGNSMYVITRYADVSAVLRDHHRFSSEPSYVVDGTGERISPLREQDQPRHSFLRKIIAPMFTPKEMRRLVPYFTQLANELLDAAERDPVVEVSSQLAIPLPGRVTCDLLGLPLESHERFYELTAERRDLDGLQSGRVMPSEGDRTLAELRAEQWAIVEPVAQARRKKPEHDAISLLVAAQEQVGRDDITDDLIVDMLLHLLTGGFHTTQHLIEMLVDLLADRPDLWDELRADRDLIWVAIEEMLRYDAPVQALRRRTIEPVEIEDVQIPAEAKVAVVYGSANRDERAFDDPDVYRVDRGPTRHLAFSAGIHYCPGAPVSRFEVHALFNEMLDRYRSLERAAPAKRRIPGDKLTVEALHGYEHVPVHFERA